MSRYCIDCRHSWMGEQLGATGLFCRRNPPSVHLVPRGPGQLGFQSVRPSVDKNETCGEFSPDENTMKVIA